jgi:hypothetical protein
MFPCLSRSLKATFRLFITVMGCPRAFKYIICSEGSMVGHGVGKKSRIALTKLLFALQVALKHATPYSGVEGLSRESEDLLYRWELCAMGLYIASYKDNDKGCS